MELRYRGDDPDRSNKNWKRYFPLYLPSVIRLIYKREPDYSKTINEGRLTIIYGGLEVWL